VQPGAVPLRDLGQLGQRVDRAGVGEPALTDTNRGRRPAAASAASAAASRSGRMRCCPSTGSTLTWSEWKPSVRAARASDECAWSET
jgi:hypothetical protein